MMSESNAFDSLKLSSAVPYDHYKADVKNPPSTIIGDKHIATSPIYHEKYKHKMQEIIASIASRRNPLTPAIIPIWALVSTEVLVSSIWLYPTSSTTIKMPPVVFENVDELSAAAEVLELYKIRYVI